MKPYRARPEFYDAEYSGMKMLQNDVAFFLDHLPKKRQNILEFAVGTGRAAIPIAQAGHRVLGIDIDKKMLELAARKRDAVGIKPRDLKLVPGNALTFNTKEKFDWVCIFFNTFLAFTTLQQQDQFLQNARRHLKPRGRGNLWIDIFNPDLARLAKPKQRKVEPHFFYVPSLNRTVFSWTDIDRDLAKQIQRITFHYQWFDDHGVEHHEKNRFDLTFIFPRELKLLLDRNGLKLRQLYGNYDGSDLSSDSPRMIAWCTI
jgi:SAM-dependent methyltransferase